MHNSFDALIDGNSGCLKLGSRIYSKNLFSRIGGLFFYILILDGHQNKRTKSGIVRIEPCVFVAFLALLRFLFNSKQVQNVE